MIHLALRGEKIELSGWVGPNTPALCKSVGGGRFSKVGEPHWSFPLTMTTCRRLREVFGQQLVIADELNVWARAAKTEEELIDNIKNMREPGELLILPTAAPELARLAHPYQRAGIGFGAHLGTFGLFDQPGLGKTAQTIGSILERGGAHRFHLILAPKIAVETVWPAEVARWAPGVAKAFALTGTRQNREKTLTAALECKNPHVFVCANIEMVRDRTWGLHAIEWGAVVVDESHRALIRKSVKSESQQRKGITALKARHRIALSGTPMRGKPQQLWGTLNWLRPDVYTSYWNFVGQYFELEHTPHSNFVLGGLKPGAEDRMARDLAPLILRRTKAEVLPELPPKTYAGSYLIPGDPDSPFGVWLTPSAKHLKQYEDFFANAVVEDETGEIVADGTLAEYTRKSQLSSAIHSVEGDVLRPTCDSVKYEWLLDKCSELGIPDEGRIVVASRFTKLVNVFAAGLRVSGIPCHVLTGETSSAERQRIIADFQSNAPTARVFFLNTMAGGVAVTLDAADELVMLDESTIPDDQEQVEDRVHRASRIHNVTIHYLRTLGTQDEEIAWVAAARESVLKYVLDGARGVDYARQLYLHTKENQ